MCRKQKTAEGSAVCGITRISEFDAHAGGQFAGTDVFDIVDFADVVVAVAGIQIDIGCNGIAYAANTPRPAEVLLKLSLPPKWAEARLRLKRAPKYGLTGDWVSKS